MRHAPSFEVVHADVSKHWGLMGRFIMGLRDQKTLLVRFELESGMLMALSRDPTMTKESTFKVFHWKHVANGSYDTVIAPVWITLPKLPERYWFLEFLIAIGDSIGRFIRVDLLTVSMARPSVARICVGVDLSRELPLEIGIKYKGIIWQKIVYRNMPAHCTHCRMQGYNIKACKRAHQTHQQPSNAPAPNPTSAILNPNPNHSLRPGFNPNQLPPMTQPDPQTPSPSVPLQIHVPNQTNIVCPCFYH